MLEMPYCLKPKWMRRHTHTRLVGVVRECWQHQTNFILLARRSQAAYPAVGIGTCVFNGIGRSRCRAGLRPGCAIVGLGSLSGGWSDLVGYMHRVAWTSHHDRQALSEYLFLICSQDVRYKASQLPHSIAGDGSGAGERVTGV